MPRDTGAPQAETWRQGGPGQVTNPYTNPQHLDDTHTRPRSMSPHCLVQTPRPEEQGINYSASFQVNAQHQLNLVE